VPEPMILPRKDHLKLLYLISVFTSVPSMYASMNPFFLLKSLILEYFVSLCVL